MKKFGIMAFALMFNAITGGLFAAVLGLSPIVGAVGMNIIGALVPQEKGTLKIGIYREVWTAEMIKAFRNSIESLGWISKIRSHDQYAQNDVIHFVDLGGDPGVLINNTSYPIDVEDLEDSDKAISLDKYQTKATRITDDELYAISYDKIGSVIERHREVIDETKYSRALHALAPVSHGTKTPVILTTGTVSDDGQRKILTKANIIALKKQFDDLKVPTAGRVLVLCSDHVNDLLLQDQKFADQYYNYTSGKIANLYSFEVYEYSDSPYFTVSTKAKLPYGSVPQSTDRQASVAFFAPRMMRATGSTTSYLSEAKDNPTTQENLANFRHYFICLPLKNEAIAAIVSDIVSEDVVITETIEVLPETMEFAAAGGSLVAAVNASSEFTVSITGTGFTQVTDGNAITITAAANTGEERTAEVTITVTADTTKTATIAVTQAAGN